MDTKGKISTLPQHKHCTDKEGGILHAIDLNTLFYLLTKNLAELYSGFISNKEETN